MSVVRAQVSPQEPVTICSAPSLAVAAGILVAVFTVLFGTWTATSPWSFVRFLVAALLLIVAPGELLVDVARLRTGPLARLTLALILGTIASSLVYWIAVFVGISTLFFLWPLAATAALFLRHRGGWKELCGLRLRMGVPHWLLLGIIVLGLIPLAALPLYYRDLARLPEGGMSYLGLGDTLLHLSVANELTHAIPPTTPFFAGRALNYHYGVDVPAAMFSRIAGISVLDLTVRFMPTCFVVVTMLAIFCFSRRWFDSSWAAPLAVFLVFFGEDFSFLPGLLLHSPNDWSVEFFAAPTTFSLYFANPMLPALGLLFGGLFCLVAFCQDRGRAWLILTACLFAVLAWCKVYAGAQVLLSLAIAASLELALLRRTRLLMVLALTSLLMIPSLMYMWHRNEAMAAVAVQVGHGTFISDAVAQLRLADTTWGRRVEALLTGGQVSVPGLVALVGLALPGYLLGSLGLRAVAIPRVLKALLGRSPAAPVGLFLATFALLGPIITLTCKVAPLVPLSPTDAYNGSVWFYVQSKYVLWIFLVEAVIVFCQGKRAASRALALGLVVSLSIPSALQHFSTLISLRSGVVESNELQLIDFLREDSRPGDVVLSQARVSRIVLAMTRCHVPFVELPGIPFQFVPAAELQERWRDRDAFWGAWRAGEVRRDILGRYQVAYVVVDERGEGARRAPPAIPGGETAQAGRLALHRRFVNGAFIVYKVGE